MADAAGGHAPVEVDELVGDDVRRGVMPSNVAALMMRLRRLSGPSVGRCERIGRAASAQAGEEVGLGDRLTRAVERADEGLLGEDVGERVGRHLHPPRLVELAGVRGERGALLLRVRRACRRSW